MLLPKLILQFLFVISLKLLALETSANPTGKFAKLLPKREISTCQDALGSNVDLAKIADEIAIEFLNTGDIEALDQAIDYLIDLECFSKRETLEYRKLLIVILDMINNHHGPKQFLSNTFEKRWNINGLNPSSKEVLKYVVNNLNFLEETQHLRQDRANSLLNKIIKSKDKYLQMD